MTGISTVFGQMFFDKIKDKWNKTDDEDPYRVEYALERFLFFKEKRMIAAPKNDITTWLDSPFAPFEKLIYELDVIYTNIQNKKKKVKDINQVFENENIVIIIPNKY